MIKGKLLGIKAASLSTSFASLQHVKKACDFWDAASWFEWILLCSKLESRHSFILNLVFVWMLVEIQGIGWSWFWEQPRAWWSVLGYKTIKSSSPCLSLSLVVVFLSTNFSSISLSQGLSPAAEAPKPEASPPQQQIQSTRCLPPCPVPQRTEFPGNSADQPAL